MVRDAFQLVSKRSRLDLQLPGGHGLLGARASSSSTATTPPLYFIVAVDESESELGILDLIQVFVEALDKCFSNVCELDLIFHTDRIHFILDEMVMAGMVFGDVVERYTEGGRWQQQVSAGHAADGRAEVDSDWEAGRIVVGGSWRRCQA